MQEVTAITPRMKQLQERWQLYLGEIRRSVATSFALELPPVEVCCTPPHGEYPEGYLFVEWTHSEPHRYAYVGIPDDSTGPTRQRAILFVGILIGQWFAGGPPLKIDMR